MNQAHPGTGVASQQQPIGRFYSWWRGDALPELPRLPDFAVTADDVDSLLGPPPVVDPAFVTRLTRQSHHPYVAWIGGEVVAFGWSATATASIGELGIEMALPPGNRYLWGFETLPRWRGTGIYPVLLQEILRREAGADRFWIGHDIGNVASARGILKAGFSLVGEVYEYRERELTFMPCGQRERSDAAAALLGLPLAHDRSLQ